MSESLEALDSIGFHPVGYDGKEYTRIKDEYSKEFDIIEKELKALEIIKEKEVNVGYFVNRLVFNNLSYEEYIEEQETPYLDIYVSHKKLTKEEYDLLKEVLS